MYKTSMYDMALFLLVVKTNVTFCPAAVFLVQHEETEAIRSAIQTIAQNMHDNGFHWDPEFWMADKSWAEFRGVQAVFPRE